ncbi:hypothetical protein IGI04_007558 [Brassica rapa subsp. trilocularis]|uniref:Uncharacterized protein n=1 Tax=Brassica rapa subsp. trilocularis TaxID=1813537 RepID=A0ABQ7NNB1_BRACM|nr:hypothetical protein IGI04_007558 [Brassica rapa subsp. trilocularis]
MDPNQTIGTTPSRIDNVDPAGSNSRTKALPVGPTGTDGTTGTTHTQQIPPIGTSNQERSSVHDRSSPPDRTGARVLNRLGERQADDDLIRPQSDRASGNAAYRAIANRLDQAERELAEHRANARERHQSPPDPLRETLNPQNVGAFGTPEIPSARSGCYTGENSQ